MKPWAPDLPATRPTARVEAGLSPAVDRVADRASGDPGFLGRPWFGAADRTIVLDDGNGRVLAALPVKGMGPLGVVPGGYWPCRGIPVDRRLDAAGMAALLNERDALGLALRLGPVCEDDPALLLLRDALPATPFRLLEREVGRCFVQELTPEESAEEQGGKRDGARERKLAALGAVEWLFARGPALLDGPLDAMAAVEAASWQARDGDRKLVGAERARWDRMAADPRGGGVPAACVLLVAGRPVAFSLDLDVGATRWGVCSGYDPAFRQVSPGRLLHRRNLRRAAADGIRFVNWGCGDSGYKRDLGAVPGPRLLDVLLVRDWPGLPALAGRLWRLLDDARRS